MILLMILSCSVFFSMLTFSIQRKHLLMSLLSLEAMILTLTMLTVCSLGLAPQFNTYLFIVLLTFGACEASLGLSLLVAMTRYFGNDYTNLLTMNKC
uniref:NADH-ubiquinone oxidoreductase chain 4L n=1 Tax=Pista cristata TaxID=279652 RepID=B3TK01_9ANNE|nr:NADH dehydrogenase subunit 4L [Pista cristata]